MGIVFAPFSLLFVERPQGMAFALYWLSCISAGLIVGWIAYLLGRHVMLEYIREPIARIQRMLHSDSTRQRHPDLLADMRLDLEDIGDIISTSAQGVSENEALITNLNRRFTHALEALTQGEITHRELAAHAERDLKAYDTLVTELEQVFQQQQHINAGVLEGITQLRQELISLSHQIKVNSEENLHHANDIQRESQRFFSTIELLDETAGIIGQMAQDVQALAKEASQSTQEIQEIAEISAQTRLLALNANIEAAKTRGGHNGFRVIAGAVSELAQRSDHVVEGILISMGELEKRSQSIATSAITREEALRHFENQSGEAKAAQSRISSNLQEGKILDARLLSALSNQETEMGHLMESTVKMGEIEQNVLGHVDALREGFTTLSEVGNEVLTVAKEQQAALDEITEIYNGLVAFSQESANLAKHFHAPSPSTLKSSE